MIVVDHLVFSVSCFKQLNPAAPTPPGFYLRREFQIGNIRWLRGGELSYPLDCSLAPPQAQCWKTLYGMRQRRRRNRKSIVLAAAIRQVRPRAQILLGRE
jgi:hypothetical protein